MPENTFPFQNKVCFCLVLYYQKNNGFCFTEEVIRTLKNIPVLNPRLSSQACAFDNIQSCQPRKIPNS